MGPPHRLVPAIVGVGGVGGEGGEPIIMKLRPAVLDRNGSSLDPAGFAEGLAKCGQHRSICFGRGPIEVAYDRHRLLLRARGQRPHSCTASNPDKLAPSHARQPRRFWTSVAEARPVTRAVYAPLSLGLEDVVQPAEIVETGRCLLDRNGRIWLRS